MTTRSRIRRHIDIGRLRDAIAGPGSDPRNWCSFARIDVDPDAIEWDDVLGWLVDVTFSGGELEGEGPCRCRLGWGYVAGGEGRSDPPTQGAQCVVVLPEGDPNVMPVIVGFLTDPDKVAPTSVNGTSIDEAYALATHIFVTSKALDEQLGGAWRMKSAQDVTVSGDGTMRLTGKLTVVVDSDGTVSLGGDGLTALLNGVVIAQGIDTFTGLSYGVLGNASSKVLAKKA